MGSAAQLVQEAGGDYLLTVKGNQETLQSILEDQVTAAATLAANSPSGHDAGGEERQDDQAVRSGKNCSRHETRAIETTPVSAASVGFAFAAQAGRLSTLVE